jgi:hypothetical protein
MFLFMVNVIDIIIFRSPPTGNNQWILLVQHLAGIFGCSHFLLLLRSYLSFFVAVIKSFASWCS